jgi:hypothetical protein
VDATIDTLTGATILRATRNGIWLELETTKGLVILGARATRSDLHCLGCGEERLVEVVQTAGKDEAVCGVCARSWTLDRG